MSSTQNALQVAQDFIRFVETRDRSGIERSLADNVRQVFPMGSHGWTGLGAVYEGKDEVLTYTYELFDNFDKLTWVDKVWTAGEDGVRVFLQANSDAIAAHSKAPYRNVYVTRIDVVDGKITQILEYAIAELFLALGTGFTQNMERSVQRAQSLGPNASI